MTTDVLSLLQQQKTCLVLFPIFSSYKSLFDILGPMGYFYVYHYNYVIHTIYKEKKILQTSHDKLALVRLFS